MPAWLEWQDAISNLARQQLFFIGGAPRSGTTWLQLLLDSHPEVCCRGEGLFLKHLAEPVERTMLERCRALQAKNDSVFRGLSGFPLPTSEDAEFVIGTAILLALQQTCSNRTYSAVGEKTPENVFFFPRLKRLFPRSKFIGIARDPRDVLSSAWHFFHKEQPGEDEVKAKVAFIRLALPSLQQGGRAMLALADQYPVDCKLVTYEAMRAEPEEIAAQLFRFLDVSDTAEVVAGCVARTSFAALSGGRPAGSVQEGSFFRKGAVGDWQSTFTPDMNAIILHELGWMFPVFKWTP